MIDAATTIENGKAVLGIEFGSTRIKAVLIDTDQKPIASGSYDWENRLENGIWTYSLEDIHKGLQGCYSSLKKDVKEKYGIVPKKLGAIGFSAMMHGYLPFDKDGRLLVPFRTWRNTMTQEAAEELTRLFDFNIPQRWSIAHFYQAMLNEEEHIDRVAYFTTLDGYIHGLMTGEKVLGVGSASGMFPIDSKTGNYNASMIKKFNELAASKGHPTDLWELLPKVLTAGENAGTLTAEGSLMLDPEGDLEAGCPLCPPEGDAGTGMAATNSVAPRTGNVSAGTSVFAMIVLEKPLKNVHTEIDMVTTPSGDDVAMVHCNNCTSDLNVWVKLFAEFAESLGADISTDRLFELLYNKALDADDDCGGLVAYNYFSGEPITDTAEGRPLLVRMPDSKMSLPNLMRTLLYSSLATLKIGLDILMKEENTAIDSITGHGGLFKTKGVGQKILAGAINAPVSVMETAGEGGAWGMALLASYMIHKKENESLGDYLRDSVFAGSEGETLAPDKTVVKSFDAFAKRYKAGLEIEKAAVLALK